MQITENRAKQQKQIIDKIQSIFNNAEHIVQFQFEINGGVGMVTRVRYTVVENLVEEDKCTE
jgi:hypothetical protein